MKNDTYERVNITLPSRTLRRLDRIAPHGERSQFIDEAVRRYLNADLKKSLVKGFKRAALDPDIEELAEWGMDDYARIVNE